MGWGGPMTHRQFLGWSAWDEMQWEIPDRSDYYLMQIAQRVMQVLSSKPGDIKLNMMKLNFVKASESSSSRSRTRSSSSGSRSKGLSADQATAVARSKWFSAFGGASKIRGAQKPTTESPSPPPPASSSEFDVGTD